MVSCSNQLSCPIVLMGYCNIHRIYRRKAILSVVLAATSAGHRHCHHHLLGARRGKARAVAVQATGTMRFFAWDALRKNGSLFNSPATTAAALVHHYDDKALNYLHCVVNIFGSAVPALYPPNIYSKLSMVDILEKVGISRHFRSEINSILDKAYMLWSQRDEEVMLDLATCAMAFRLLRMNGYDVSSEELSHVAEASAFSSSVEGYMDDTETILEMYKASEVCLSGNEPILEKVGSWTDPLEHKKNIENFDVRASQILKAKNLVKRRTRKPHIFSEEVQYFNFIPFPAFRTVINGQFYTWIYYLSSLSAEAEWRRNKYVPTMEEYLTNAVVGYGLGPITLMLLYFLGRCPWEDIIEGPEYSELLRLSSLCGRLMNDSQTFERECKDGKLNSVSLLVLESGGTMSIEAAKEAIWECIASYRRDLLRLFLGEGSPVPTPGREIPWRFYKTSHVFYCQGDEYSSAKEMLAALSAAISEPLKVEDISPCLH
ncbi:hypothetical protein PR202_gb25485 [Eleusine coracana subsp. coracana]|uniref:Uncharacterized protein n=1 Tax=Eleusine coracana subsp. coracana TaxID=191504 RepID=A0AAV5FLL6_ELECO|nr:hypothetical protein PR202_gb25485 [Eleusine coracana subsp. coracana]